jgi:hypothetical protein
LIYEYQSAIIGLERNKGNNMQDFKDIVKTKTIPITFVFRCTLCGFEVTDYDRHFGLIKMNQHVISKHSKDVCPLDMEDLYSRKPTITLDTF